MMILKGIGFILSFTSGRWNLRGTECPEGYGAEILNLHCFALGNRF
jgi:hypothetical protein